ncbi:MAG: UDP-N-acetylmuramate--L-alanine ligase [Candidatus Omnitrophica bacterium]|nr:UDP-N-acetylmuramate--L-alanine ligase [Candidatus Omnitrophota bacterium]
MLRPGLKIHFVGIGGVGMSGLAKVLLEKGMVVSGSDINLNNYTESLCSRGAKIFKGHKSSSVRDADIVVYSSSISSRNIELIEARRLKKPVLSRLTLFQEFTKAYRSIMVTGTHGKTTTTSLIAYILLNLGLDPTVLLGGDLNPFGNARLGKSEYLAAELDESDGEFVKVKPALAIITNIENDHLDHFENFSGLTSAFEKFIMSTSKGLILCRDDKVLQGLQSRIVGKKFSTYGFNPGCDYRAYVVSAGRESRFNFFCKDKLLGEVHLPIPGRHNILNAAAAISAALTLGLEFNKVREVLSHFQGAARRFELKGEEKGVKVIEDYGHHPTEIKAVLSSARLCRPRRILVIFQPHRYTRTRLLMDEFTCAFSDADILAITDIYSAGEKNISRVSSKDIVRCIKKKGHKNVSYFKTPEEAAAFAKGEAKEGDMIFILGAGDVNRISKKILHDL